ncbi:hypothetical protein KEJ45_03190 [Candidatus Bathyarchaeota archaeon]|nr:hypothetical protein [Candidatus Bathyarchaeota archaeon]
MSSEKRRKRSPIDEFFGNSIFDEMEAFLKDFPENEFAGGYSISVVQTPEGTTVKAKVGKNTDVNTLKKQLEKQYPHAKIEIEGGKQEPLIREISTKPIREEKTDEKETD